MGSFLAPYDSEAASLVARDLHCVINRTLKRDIWIAFVAGIDSRELDSLIRTL